MTAPLIDWLYNQALPLWRDKGIDLRGGGFEEALGPDGAKGLVDYKRTLVQARQIYVYSHAYIRSGDKAWLNAAANGFDFLTRHCWNHLNGGWHYSVSANGQPKNTVQDLYTQAFVLFASAWYSKASNSPVADVVGNKTWRFIETRLQHPKGGFYEDGNPIGALAETRRQNPHMHLLEACLAQLQATEQTIWSDRADLLVDLALTNFIGDALLEFFDDDLTPKTGEDQIVEPGHHYEWYWLLHLYQSLGGKHNVKATMDRIYSFAQTHGHHGDSGLVIDQTAPDGTSRRSSSRLWPQTEWIKAQTVREGTPANTPADLLHRNYLKGLDGQWTDHPMTEAEIKSELKSPASSFYHIYCAIDQMQHL